MEKNAAVASLADQIAEFGKGMTKAAPPRCSRPS